MFAGPLTGILPGCRLEGPSSPGLRARPTPVSGFEPASLQGVCSLQKINPENMAVTTSGLSSVSEVDPQLSALTSVLGGWAACPWGLPAREAGLHITFSRRTSPFIPLGFGPPSVSHLFLTL